MLLLHAAVTIICRRGDFGAGWHTYIWSAGNSQVGLYRWDDFCRSANSGQVVQDTEIARGQWSAI
jgi:hypothetical protein